MYPRALATLVVLLLPAAASGACGDQPGDPSDVALAHQQVMAECLCESAGSHGAYMRCARDVARRRVENGGLATACARQVTRCAGRSTPESPDGFCGCAPLFP